MNSAETVFVGLVLKCFNKASDVPEVTIGLTNYRPTSQVPPVRPKLNPIKRLQKLFESKQGVWKLTTHFFIFREKG